MHTQADKRQETRTRPVRHYAAAKTIHSNPSVHFGRNGPEAIQLRKLETIANGSPGAKKAAQLKDVIDNSAYAAVQRRKLERMGGEPLTAEGLPLLRKALDHDENELEARAEQALVQNQILEEEEPVQGKFEAIPKKKNTAGMPGNLKSGIETLSGMSMDDVTVHYDSSKPARLQASAYTQGTDIYIAPGQEKHIAHEAWHVVQQKQGRVKPTMQMKGGVNINDDAALEKEADFMGAKALNISALFDKKSSSAVANAACPTNLSACLQLRPDVEVAQKPPSPAMVVALGGDWGLTIPEDIRLTFNPTLENGLWKMDIRKIKGRFSQQVRLLPGAAEVTGPAGNSNAGNYANQIQDLRALGNPAGGAAWYMLQAVQDHEDVHKSQFLTALSTRASRIEEQFDGLTAPGHLSQAAAKNHIQALAGFIPARTAGFNQWFNECARRIADDHRPGGRTDTAERRVVNPMISSINDEAANSGWGPRV